MLTVSPFVKISNTCMQCDTVTLCGVLQLTRVDKVRVDRADRGKPHRASQSPRTPLSTSSPPQSHGVS